MILAQMIMNGGRFFSSRFLNLIKDRECLVSGLTILILFIGMAGFGATQDTRLARYMSMTYAVLAALGLRLSVRSLPSGLFVLWVAFIFYVHPSTPILVALSALVYAGGIVVIAGARDLKRTAMNMICVYALANVLWQVLQITGHTFSYNPIYYGWASLVGLQTNIGETSVLMAICLPAFFRRRWAWLIPVPLAGLIMAKASVGMIAIAVVCFVYALYRIFKEPARVVGLFSLGFIVVVVALHLTVVDPFIWEQQKNSRIATWKDSLVIALGKPVRGQGFGQFSAMVPLLSTPFQLTVEDRQRLYAEVEDKAHFLALANEITGGDAEGYYAAKKYPLGFYLEAHNEYIEVLFAAGIPGLILFLGGLAHILWRGWKQKDRRPFYGLLASCVGATVWFTWQIVPIAVITIAWTGMCLGRDDEHA